MIMRTSATRPSTIQAARRQECASQGPVVTVTATAPARKAGLGKPAFATNASRARLAATSGGTECPSRRSSADSAKPAATAPPATVPRRRKRRRRNRTATTATTAAMVMTWTRPVNSSPGMVSGSNPVTVVAREPSRRPGINEVITTVVTRITPLMIKRTTSPG